MARTDGVFVLRPMALHLKDATLRGAAYKGKDAALVYDLSRLVKVAVKEKMQAVRGSGYGVSRCRKIGGGEGAHLARWSSVTAGGEGK